MDNKNLPVIPGDRADDLHNLEFADSADLILFMAGNQFMVMKEIVSAFKKEYPDIEKIFYETLPPFDIVEPGEDLDQRNRINYYVCKLKHARHPENADKFIEFIRSTDARQIYQKYGFLAHL